MKNIKDNASYRVMKKNRKTWEINPVERVVKSKKEYNRNKAKQELKQQLEEEDEAFNIDFAFYNDPIDNNYD